MEKEESPTDATVELDGDDMEGSGEEGDLEGSDSEAAQWADQEQWFGMQWPSALAKRLLSFSTSEKTSTLLDCGVCECRDAIMLTAAFWWWVTHTDINWICGWRSDLLAFWFVWSLVLKVSSFVISKDYLSHMRIQHYTDLTEFRYEQSNTSLATRMVWSWTKYIGLNPQMIHS